MRNIFIILSLFLFTSILEAQETRLLRYPNTSADEITFVYGGDIYTVGIKGGIARRLTSSEGYEQYPRYSPDGSTIAFVGEYDGNMEIYTMPSIGGTPKRITYSYVQPNVADRQGPDKIIMQWTKDGNDILFRSREKSWNILVGHLQLVNKDGGLPTPIEVARGGFASFSPDGKKMAYNRIFREYRTWKRYSGGQADDIYIFDFATKKLENISNTKFQDIIPMWSGDKIYYLSDRDFTMNIFCYDLKTKQTKKITNFDNYDVKFPSLGKHHIAFENGGYIYLLDLATDEFKKIPITVQEDFPDMRPSLVKVSNRIINGDIAPNGKRAIFTARGDIFNFPAENGNVLNLTNSNDVHDRNAVWSPDGKYIAFISDRSGTDEIYLMDQDGKNISQLTNNGKFYRYSLKWSPNSKYLLTHDNTRNFYYIDIASKKQVEITKSKSWNISDYTWSSDSKWIAYTGFANPKIGQIILYSLDKSENYPVTDGFYSAYSPEFSADNKFLYYVADKTFNPSFGNFEYNFQYNNMSSIFGVTLQDTILQPFAIYKNDVVESQLDVKDKKDTDKKINKDKDNLDLNLRIDLNGIKDREFELPITASNYGSLYSAKGNRLYYSRMQRGSGSKLYYYDFDNLEEKEVGDVSSYTISFDGKTILYTNRGEYYITKLGDKLNGKDGKIDVNKMEVMLDKRLEWKQVYNESWRHFRDFFYDPNMHGYDWNQLRDKYAELLPYVVHRSDLTYIIGELIGELDAGHAYVTGGDMPKVKAMPIASLAADYEYDTKSGYYKITKIYEGMNWETDMRSPFTEPGMNVKVGDYIIKIDGVPLTQSLTPSSQLINKADKFISITINNKPSLDGAREIFVKPIKSDIDIRYYNWVEHNRKYVDSVTNGRVAYVHIPDMMPNNGLNWFARYFYPQIDKEALIVDDRYNGGGNVSPMVIERLRRELVIAKYARNSETITTNPDAVMTGPMVCLINEQSMSDGDLFPYQFHTLGLGPLIGKRTWGGVVGIYGSLPLLDGSSVNRPEVANFGADGNWVLEDVGMKPDIDVDNDPYLEFIGQDQQLDRGIEEVLKLIKTSKKTKLPQRPPFPDKKRDFGK
ncbi:MAG TPA: PDZ domain-containing protein [Candidatus Kapabacteria bacterium]|nr:PDZ domain-containing protein [Candidatus Kapabacteria bacterium]